MNLMPLPFCRHNYFAEYEESNQSEIMELLFNIQHYSSREMLIIWKNKDRSTAIKKYRQMTRLEDKTDEGEGEDKSEKGWRIDCGPSCYNGPYLMTRMGCSSAEVWGWGVRMAL
jgi:hypothetical protein